MTETRELITGFVLFGLLCAGSIWLFGGGFGSKADLSNDSGLLDSREGGAASPQWSDN